MALYLIQKEHKDQVKQIGGFVQGNQFVDGVKRIKLTKVKKPLMHGRHWDSITLIFNEESPKHVTEGWLKWEKGRRLYFQIEEQWYAFNMDDNNFDPNPNEHFSVGGLTLEESK